MDKQNYVVIVAVIAAAVVVIVGLVVWYLRKNCQPMSCPNVPASQYTDTPTGVCLLDCDQYSDVCYCNCNPKDEDCIRRCYQMKANCYIKCLGNQQERFSNAVCGCV
ncbi:hypothetical protein LCGC14_1778210 [marine sediment metagenome]|uniref:Uncharacterized protein n=1 Tax=marine sediment metagenome TaxID=412755 RepID=A0A0F9GWA9_9ZZZZ